MNHVAPGLYRHFKGAIVEVLGVGKHSETMEELVLYRHADTGELWARPTAMFLEEIERDGRKMARFSKAASQ